MTDLNKIILALAIAIAITTFRVYKNGIEGDEMQRIFFYINFYIGDYASSLNLIFSI